jgi:hypothetical protein
MKPIQTTLLVSVLVLSAAAYSGEGQQFQPTNTVNLASVRSLLTTNLTLKVADARLGEPRFPALVSGSIKQRWNLDDGNILSTAFELLLPSRLLWARVQDKNGKVIEEILKDQRHVRTRTLNNRKKREPTTESTPTK